MRIGFQWVFFPHYAEFGENVLFRRVCSYGWAPAVLMVGALLVNEAILQVLKLFRASAYTLGNFTKAPKKGQIYLLFHG